MAFSSKSRSSSRWVWRIIILVGLVYLVSRLFFEGPGPGPMGMNGAAPVSVAEVVARDITRWREFSGRLEAMEQAQVRARIAGSIEKIYFKDNAVIQRGQPLFLIDPRPYQAAVTQAEGQLASARANFANATLEANRATRLMQANAIARKDYEMRLAQARSAEGALKAAEGALAAAKLNLHYTVITAPITGKIGRAEITLGNLVNNEAVLATMVSQSPLYVAFEADEQTYLSFLRTTQSKESLPVQMGLADETATPHTGRIDSFDNALDPASGTLRARALFDNADGSLLPGLFARVRIGTPQAMPAILINEKAVGTDQTSKFVFVVGTDNKAEIRKVVLGATEGSLRVVESGLSAGEKIIVNGLVRARPGADVVPTLVDMETLEAPTPAKAS